MEGGIILALVGMVTLIVLVLMGVTLRWRWEPWAFSGWSPA